MRAHFLTICIGVLIGGAIMMLVDGNTCQRDLAKLSTTSNYSPNEYSSYDTYDTYDYGGISYGEFGTCTDAIALPGHLFCKEDQEIATLADQIKHVGVNLVDPGQSMLYWRFTRT